MSDTTLPSWRVRPPERARAGWGIPPLVWLLGSGLIGVGALGVLVLWGAYALSPGGVPLVEADERPYRVRPDNHVATAPLPPDDSIFQRPSARVERFADARLAAGPERPMPDGWRQVVAPVARPPAPVEAPAAAQRVAAPAIAPARAAAPRGGVQVQLGALLSEEAAMNEWSRLRNRVPELEGHAPNVLRFDREGRPSFWRLRIGGLPDRDAAQSLCGQVRARGGNCAVLGS